MRSSTLGFVRRLRGVLFTALTWAVGWTPFGIAWAAYAWYFLGHHLPAGTSRPPTGFLAALVLAWATFGAVSGAVFATALTLAERRRSLDELSVWRTALWGALGALALPVALMSLAVKEGGLVALPLAPVLVTVGVSAALGAGSAAGTLALARRGA